VTVAKVVDTSALGAVLFAEPAGEGIVDRLRDASLVAPALLGYELANICVRKIRANPEQRTRFLTAFASWREMRIALVDVDYDAVLSLAEETGLTGYDASYLWLARQLDADW
jgi:predicted nucleic acid-binding protein